MAPNHKSTPFPLAVLLLSLLTAAGLSRAETGKTWSNDLSAIGEADWNATRAAHLLERAGFGDTPEEVARLAAMTPRQAVDFLLNYEQIDDSMLPRFDHSNIYPYEHKLVPLEQVVGPALLTGKAYGVDAVQKTGLRYQPAINEFYTLLVSEFAECRRLSQWWAQRMLISPRPLQEKLTLFWHDHFATSQAKVLNYQKMGVQMLTLRKHAAGNLRDLLVAVAQDPAMLDWLDNRDNVRGKPNENFAREIMELFTMGEGQGYTEDDIREMARAFTGWTTNAITTTRDVPRFIDNKWQHDNGSKAFLGQSGRYTGYDAIDIILKQPAASRFITRKLYEYFVRESIDPKLNDELAKLLVEAKYEIKPLLRAIFLSRDFYSEPSVGTQIKSPVHLLVSTYRKLGLKEIPGIPDFVDTTESLGQLLFFPPNVAGWPGGKSWINPATLLARGNFAHALLFPDPQTFIAPDKVIAEGYQRIPLLFKEYDIKPHIWNAKSQKMEPVSLLEYDRYLAGIGPGATAQMQDNAPKKGDLLGGGQMMQGSDAKSKMGQVSKGEDYNLAVGVYTGFVQAYNRVKPVTRTQAQIDFVAMLRDAKVKTCEQAVEYFCNRLLSVPLHADRRAAIVSFFMQEVGSNTIDFTSDKLKDALRRAVHLILSAPEYQLG